MLIHIYKTTAGSFPFGCSLEGDHLSPSSSLTPTDFMSSFSTYINLLLGLPLELLPDSFRLIILPQRCSQRCWNLIQKQITSHFLNVSWKWGNRCRFWSYPSSSLPQHFNLCSVIPSVSLNQTTPQVSPPAFAPFLPFLLIILSSLILSSILSNLLAHITSLFYSLLLQTADQSSTSL